MEFFCYHRDRPGSERLRDELLEAHWSYMDRFQAAMIARGPTLAGDGAPTGSVHARYGAIEVHSWQFGGRPS